MNGGKIDVVVVDDSRVLRLLLVHLLESDPDIRVLAALDNGAAVLDLLERSQPHVLLMDIHMEGMDGFEVTRRIMETRPLPIVLCSASSDPREVEVSFRAIEAGAVAVVEKPVAREHADFEQLVNALLGTVKAMAEVKVVRRWSRLRSGRSAPANTEPGRTAPIRLVGIGASTGGPPALQTVLGGLPKDFNLPILIVQHISPGFLPGLAQWLGQTVGRPVQIASYGQQPQPGHVYLAPDDLHLAIAPDGALRLTKEAPENGLRPSVDHLFHSLAEQLGPAVIGVLLTGMGKDGARGLKALRERGAATLAQDQDSSVVHGMPGEAIALDAADEVLAIDQIAAALDRIGRQRNRGVQP